MAKNNKVIKKQIQQYQHLLEHYEEMNDFIHYKILEEEFSYFKKHAHEDADTELPFPYLVL